MNVLDKIKLMNSRIVNGSDVLFSINGYGSDRERLDSMVVGRVMSSEIDDDIYIYRIFVPHGGVYYRDNNEVIKIKMPDVNEMVLL